MSAYTEVLYSGLSIGSLLVPDGWTIDCTHSYVDSCQFGHEEKPEMKGAKDTLPLGSSSNSAILEEFKVDGAILYLTELFVPLSADYFGEEDLESLVRNSLSKKKKYEHANDLEGDVLIKVERVKADRGSSNVSLASILSFTNHVYIVGIAVRPSAEAKRVFEHCYQWVIKSYHAPLYNLSAFESFYNSASSSAPCGSSAIEGGGGVRLGNSNNNNPHHDATSGMSKGVKQTAGMTDEDRLGMALSLPCSSHTLSEELPEVGMMAIRLPPSGGILEVKNPFSSHVQPVCVGDETKGFTAAGAAVELHHFLKKMKLLSSEIILSLKNPPDNGELFYGVGTIPMRFSDPSVPSSVFNYLSMEDAFVHHVSQCGLSCKKIQTCERFSPSSEFLTEFEAACGEEQSIRLLGEAGRGGALSSFFRRHRIPPRQSTFLISMTERAVDEVGAKIDDNNGTKCERKFVVQLFAPLVNSEHAVIVVTSVEVNELPATTTADTKEDTHHSDLDEGNTEAEINKSIMTHYENLCKEKGDAIGKLFSLELVFKTTWTALPLCDSSGFVYKQGQLVLRVPSDRPPYAGSQVSLTASLLFHSLGSLTVRGPCERGGASALVYFTVLCEGRTAEDFVEDALSEYKYDTGNHLLKFAANKLPSVDGSVPFTILEKKKESKVIVASSNKIPTVSCWIECGGRCNFLRCQQFGLGQLLLVESSLFLECAASKVDDVSAQTRKKLEDWIDGIDKLVCAMQVAPRVYFPQSCSHLVHSYNNKGELRTALITGGDRLIILKEGSRIAESESLLFLSNKFRKGGEPELRQEEFHVFHICICPFLFHLIRVVVATSGGIFLFEMNDCDLVWATAPSGVPATVSSGGSSSNSNSVRSSCGRLQGRLLLLPTPEKQSQLTTCHVLSSENPLGRGGPGEDLHLHNSSNNSNSRKTFQKSRDGAGGAPVATTAPVYVGLRTTRSTVITAEFVTDVSLCIVFRDETVIVTIDTESEHHKGNKFIDRVVWRSMGNYNFLSVCPFDRSIALVLHSSTIVVFPSKYSSVKTVADAAGSHRNELDESRSETFVFSPIVSMGGKQFLQNPSASSVSGLNNEGGMNRTIVQSRDGYIEIETRGLTASLGAYTVDSMEWHRAATHTLLCVTCSLPNERATSCLTLYTVQTLSSVAQFSNVYLENQMPDSGVPFFFEGNLEDPFHGVNNNGGVSSQLGKHANAFTKLQLIPSGTIPISHARKVPRPLQSSVSHPVAPGFVDDRKGYPNLRESEASMPLQGEETHTSIIPLMAYSSSNWMSVSDKLDFLHVEADGTVRTSSYKFGKHKNASFAKQRAEGVVCEQLLTPLFNMYGKLTSAEVLPRWVSHPIELGVVSSFTKELLRSRRYRLVCSFESGLRCVVMMDLSASKYVVECFLALGSYHVSSLVSFDVPNGKGTFGGNFSSEKLIAGLLTVPVSSDTSTTTAFSGEGISSACTNSGLHEGKEKQKGKEEKHDILPSLSTNCVYKGVVLFSQCQHSSDASVAILTVAPFTTEALEILNAYQQQQKVNDTKLTRTACAKDERSEPVEKMDAISSSPSLPTATASAPVEGNAEEKVLFFMQQKCPDKVKMIPALMKAVQNNADKLLVQLTAKYGTLEVPFPEKTSVTGNIDSNETAVNEAKGEFITDISNNPSRNGTTAPTGGDCCCAGTDLPLQLKFGAVTAEGVILYLCRDFFHSVLCPSTPHSGNHAITNTDPGSKPLSNFEENEEDQGKAVVIPPVSIESLAPVQSSISIGGARVVESNYAEVLPVWGASVHPSGSDMGKFSNEWKQAIVHRIHTNGNLLRRRNRVCVEDAKETAESFNFTISSPLFSAKHIVIPKTCSTDEILPSTLSPSSSKLIIECVLDCKGSFLVNHDVVVCILCRCREATENPKRTHTRLFLYGFPAVQNLYSSQVDFQLEEPVLQNVESFMCGPRGELIVAVRNKTDESTEIERWLRCFPSSKNKGKENRYYYTKDQTWNAPQLFVERAKNTLLSEPSVAPCFLAMETVQWAALDSNSNASKQNVSESETHLIFTCSSGEYLRVCTTDFLKESSNLGIAGNSNVSKLNYVSMPQYHPDSLMQLIGMAKWEVVLEVCRHLATAARAALNLYDNEDVNRDEMNRNNNNNSNNNDRNESNDVDTDPLNSGSKGAFVVKDAEKEEDDKQNNKGDEKPWYSLLSAKTIAQEIFTNKVVRNFNSDASANAGAAAASHHVMAEPTVKPLTPASVLLTDNAIGISIENFHTKLHRPIIITTTTTTATSSASMGLGHHNTTTASSRMSTAFSKDCTLEDLTVLLPQISLEGVSNSAQMDLLCIVEALHAACQFSLNVDEAAARFFFFNKLCMLRKRLRLADNKTLTNASMNTNNTTNANTGVATSTVSSPQTHVLDPSSILFFDVGVTASRMIMTASSLWAVMSDCQSILVSQLFESDAAGARAGGNLLGPKQKLTWATVEASGAAFWLKSTDQLRLLAERMAMHTYQKTNSVTDAALMFCVARKVNALAALCKLQNNLKLHAFFSRDFNEEKNKEAASANAFAAVGKGMHLYGAAFFILAGDIKSAALIILQRHENPSLALFVLRAALPSTLSNEMVEEHLRWFREVHRNESGKFPPLDMWEDTCLTWLTGSVESKIASLQTIASHPTAHPEVLCALRYARDHVQNLSHHSEQFLSRSQELTCLIRLGRYSVARQFDLCAVLHYHDAHLLVQQIMASVESEKNNPKSKKDVDNAQGKLLGTRANMQANYDTGTLVFKGFGDSDDDDNNNNNESNHNEMKHTSNEAQQANKNSAVDTPKESVQIQDEVVNHFEISNELVEILLTEIHYSVDKYVKYYHENEYIGTADSSKTSAAISEHINNVPSSRGEHVRANRKDGAVKDESLYPLLSQLYISIVREAPTTVIEHYLSCIISYIRNELDHVRWEPLSQTGASSPLRPSSPTVAKDSSLPLQTTNVPPLLAYGATHHTHTIFVCLLHLILSEMASRTKHYILATALFRIPMDVEVLRKQSIWKEGEQSSTSTTTTITTASSTSSGHPVTIFFAALLYHLHEQEELVRQEGVRREQQRQSSSQFEMEPILADAGPHESMWDNFEIPSRKTTATVAGGGYDTKEDEAPALDLEEEELPSPLFSWFHLYVVLNVSQILQRLTKKHLYPPPRSPSTKRAIDAGILPFRYGHQISTENDLFYKHHHFALRLLLSCALCYSTIRFDFLSEELCARLRSAQWGSDFTLQDVPNGVFLEMNVTVRQVLVMLSMVLIATTSEALEKSEDEELNNESFQSSFLSHSFFFQSTTGKIATKNNSFIGGNATGKSAASKANDTTSVSAKQGTQEEKSLQMLELSASLVEVLWQLPSESRISTFTVPTSAMVRRLKEKSTNHFPASLLIQLLELENVAQVKRGKTLHSSSSALSLLQDSNGGANALDRLPSSSSSPFTAATTASPAPPPSSTSTTATTTTTISHNFTLSCVECSWLRRYHTHVLLRKTLLNIAMRGGLKKDALVTDRILLCQTDRGVLYVGYDHSSCDSLVWSTEAGTFVTHGYRELLAGDNAHALESESTEKNMATAAFSQSLSAQQQMPLGGSSNNCSGEYNMTQTQTSTTNNYTNDKKTVSRNATTSSSSSTPANVQPSTRPLSSVSARSSPMPHPHLPFYLTCQRDGYVDMYPFAAQECVASYTCPRHSAPVTRVSYSPNGYLFAAGLQDGSVVGWKFTAAALEEDPLFYFPKVFIPFGLKAVLFCGERSSYVVGVGVVREPHASLPGKHTSASTASGLMAASANDAGDRNNSNNNNDSSKKLNASFSTSLMNIMSAPATPHFISSASADTGHSGNYHEHFPGSNSNFSNYGDSGKLHGKSNNNKNNNNNNWEVNVGEIVVFDTIMSGTEEGIVVRCALPFIPEFAVYLNRPDAILCVSAEGYVAVYEVHRGACTIIGAQTVDEVFAKCPPPKRESRTAASLRQPHTGKGALPLASSTANKTAATATSTSSTAKYTSNNHNNNNTHGSTNTNTTITAVSVSPYDELVAFTTSDGLALLLSIQSIMNLVEQIKQEEYEQGEDPYQFIGRAGNRPWPPTSSSSSPSILFRARLIVITAYNSPGSYVEDATFSPSMLVTSLRDGTVIGSSLVPHALFRFVTLGV